MKTIERVAIFDIEELRIAVRMQIKKYGSLRAFSKHFGFDSARVWHFVNGSQVKPPEGLLKAAGFEEQPFYVAR